MSHSIFYLNRAILFLSFCFLVFFIKTPIASAQTISEIGTLSTGESKEVTVSGLNPNERYLWTEIRTPSTIAYSDCTQANDVGEVTSSVGPFYTPGNYLLQIDGCESYNGGVRITEKAFNVVGSVVKFGPIDLGPTLQEAPNQYLVVQVKTTNPDREYTFRSDITPCRNVRGVSSPCIAEQDLIASTNGITHVEITNKQVVLNGSPLEGDIALVKPSSESWDLRANSSTTWIEYAFRPKTEITIGTPTIKLSWDNAIPFANKISQADSFNAEVTFPSPKSKLGYRVKLQDAKSTYHILDVFCTSDDSCTTRSQGPGPISGVSMDKDKLTFTVSGSTLKLNNSYTLRIYAIKEVVINNGSRGTSKTISDIYTNVSASFLVTDGILASDIPVKLNPEKISVTDTPNANITVSFSGTNNDSYYIIHDLDPTPVNPRNPNPLPPSVTCPGINCTYTIALKLSGTFAGSHIITVELARDRSIKGSAILEVIDTQTAGPTTNITNPTPGPTPKPTPCTGDKCSKSGGTPCSTDPKNPAIATAIGCVHTNPINFIEDLLKFLTAIGGGFAFLLMLLGAFQMVSSAGNPETLQAGRDRFQSALIGLLFVIFAVLLLKIIGVDILALPEFKP